MKFADNKLIAYVKYLIHTWELVKKRRHPTYLFKVRAYRKNSTEITLLNHRVDLLAKQAALMWPETLWNKSEEAVHKIHPVKPDDPINVAAEARKHH